MIASTIKNMTNRVANYCNAINNDKTNIDIGNKSSAASIMYPTDPIQVMEPIEIENNFQNPFDFESVNNPFSVEMPITIDNPFSIEMPIVSESKQPITGIMNIQRAVTPDELAEKYKCSTCESRKFQDVSSDPGVSFQSPTKVAKGNNFSAVAGHERQHVSRNQDKADMEGRKVVSQSVTYQSDKCGECGDSYISGGTTKTVTKSDDSNNRREQQQEKKYDPQKAFSFEI